jgi:hypothetical protein
MALQRVSKVLHLPPLSYPPSLRNLLRVARGLPSNFQDLSSFHQGLLESLRSLTTIRRLTCSKGEGGMVMIAFGSEDTIFLWSLAPLIVQLHNVYGLWLTLRVFLMCLLCFHCSCGYDVGPVRRCLTDSASRKRSIRRGGEEEEDEEDEDKVGYLYSKYKTPTSSLPLLLTTTTTMTTTQPHTYPHH